MAYKLNSLSSNNISLLGFCCVICLHNSAPIEPPAPLTITTLFLISACIKFSFTGTTSRPSKSSMQTSTKSSILALPDTKSDIPGIVKTSIFICSSELNTRIRSAFFALGKANKIRLILCLAIKRSISLGAYTRILLMIKPFNFLLSSIKTFGEYSEHFNNELTN